MSSLAFFFGVIGWLELLVLALLGVGMLAVLGLVVFITVKVGSQSK